MPIDLFLILRDRIGYVRQLESGMSDREFVEFMSEYSYFED